MNHPYTSQLGQKQFLQDFRMGSGCKLMDYATISQFLMSGSQIIIETKNILEIPEK